jgi:hypothetical protein
MLYRGMDRTQLDTAYNNTAAVPQRDAIVAARRNDPILIAEP